MKTKLLFFSLLMLAIGASLSSQTLTPAGSSTGSITVNAANCNTTNACIILHMASSNVGYSVTVSGTWTGTLTVEQSGDNQGSWTSATTTTANTLFTSALTPGITDVRVRGSAAMTGTAVVTITASGPATLQQITQSGSSTVSPSSRTINATDPKYNLPATGYFSCVANYTNASTTLATDTTTDAPFTAAMVGWQLFLTNGPCQGTNGATTGTVHFNGTIATFVDAHHVTLSGTPSGTCAGSQAGGVSCRAYWVPSDSATALNAAWADATLTRGQCATLVLPAGVYKFNTAIKSSTGCGTINSLATGTAYSGPSVTGQSMSGTILVADPSLNANTCGTACVFDAGAFQSLSLANFTITGGGNATVTNGNGKCKIASPAWPSTAENIFLDYWGHGTSGFSGICWAGTNGGTSYLKNINLYNAGQQCSILGPFVSANMLFAICPAGSQITGSAVWTQGSWFSAGNAGGYAVTVSSPCSASPAQMGWTSVADTIQGSFNNGAVRVQGACPVYLDGDSVVSTAGANIEVGNSGTGALATVYAARTTFSGAVTDISGSQAGSKFVDMGGNTFSGPNTLTNVNYISDGRSLKGTCTGVGTAASTLGLYGTGPNVTLTTCTSAAIGTGIPLQGARTAQNLIVTATAAGTNASSGVVTVLKNGVATTITCTIGTATTCSDGLHTVAFADGDLISIQFTTQAADTLAGVKAMVAWF